jgi:hypothetical protein
VQKPVTKFFLCKAITCLHSLYSLDVKQIQTQVMYGSPNCCLGSTKSIGNSSDAISRTASYHFQYVILYLGSALLLWSFILSLRDSTSLSHTLVYIAENSPIWHSAIRKPPPIFFDCCSCVIITQVIHIHNVGVFLI